MDRRKAVKKIVGGVSALAAYNMLPAKWEKPIIEAIFIPAHAQTSGVPPGPPESEQPPEPEPQPPETEPPQNLPSAVIEPFNYICNPAGNAFSVTTTINIAGTFQWLFINGETEAYDTRIFIADPDDIPKAVTIVPLIGFNPGDLLQAIVTNDQNSEEIFREELAGCST